MARRKKELADKLASDTPVPGWRDVVASGKEAPVQPKEEPEDEMKRKTYLLTSGIIQRVADLAERERVGINELARYLLTYALEEVESGRHELPVETEKRGRIVP